MLPERSGRARLDNVHLPEDWKKNWQWEHYLAALLIGLICFFQPSYCTCSFSSLIAIGENRSMRKAKVIQIRGVHTRPEPDSNPRTRPDPKVGFVRVSVWLCRVGSGRVRVEIGFKVIVFKFSFGNKLCNKLSKCLYLYYTFAFCSFKINSDTLLSVQLCNIKIVKFKL